MHPVPNNERGFTLVELIVAMALGLVVMGAVTAIFKSGMDATSLIVKRAEMQQNVRAGVNLIVKDVSMAGAGLRPRRLGFAEWWRCERLPFRLRSERNLLAE